MLLEHIESLGLMGWPLIIASCFSMALILERLISFALLPSLSRTSMSAVLAEVRGCSHCRNSKNNLCKNLVKGKGIRKGIAVLLSHNDSGKELREEVAGIWLLKQKQKLNTWLKPLMLIGILAPMLGLLGTVIGLIDMFRGIAEVQGPVTPDVLAGGLWTAMFTTALGLMIAIPSLAAAHGFGIWANHYLSKLEFAMNHANLLLEGLSMNDEGFSATAEAGTLEESGASEMSSCPEAVAA
ncbi:MotA/TolQ/ExbB proton channel family protein [Endozoicomonas sp. OPT23]|uniref:MotA/TolQ/ExbB proton channel family protein n=1 Tax=Endozoicomonas sp. OPT23 TaxID=2072845 RepID=UPI00129A30F7|nr:MotA/TolQ/ExbB proton channel family protein [Endozoicomonas sp. OPT23]